MNYFAKNEVIDEWTEKSEVGRDTKFRAVFLDPKVEIQLFADPNWIEYRVDETIADLITRLYEENRQMEMNSEYAHYPPDEV